jgi:hypothetical protein
MNRPSCRVPMIITASGIVNGHSTPISMASAMAPQ